MRPVLRKGPVELALGWGLGLTARGSHERKRATLHIHLIYVAAWLSIPWPWRDLGGDVRKWGIEIHHRALWWSWGEPENSWSRSDPWWRRFSFYPVDFLLGKMRCDVVTGERREALVPMPEGSYPCVLTKKTRTWSRARRPFWSRSRVEWDIQIDGGIPFMGKGEDSWNCGPDGLWGTGGSSPENAIANAVESVLRSRGRHGETPETQGRVVLAREPADA